MNIRDLKHAIEGLDDNVELYYPHYYKGYGLIPVKKLDIGDIDGEKVAVFDWKTMILDDYNFIAQEGETIKDVVKRLEKEHITAE